MTKQQWMFVAIAMTSGCQLAVDQLEVGDGLDELGGSDEIDGSDEAEGSDEGQASDECVAAGTNRDGGSEPIDYPLPECAVECASGWGHGVAPLTSAWTLDLEHDGPTTGFTHLGLLPGGDLLAFVGKADAPARLVFVSPEGELIDAHEQPAITGDAWDVGIDDAGIVYAIWLDDDVQSLSALSSSGEHLWTVELGPHQVYHSVLTPLDSGVVVALNPADEFGTSQLVRVSAAGEVTSLGTIPMTFEIAVSPSGTTVALANITTISWTDFGLFPTSSVMQGVADVSFVLGLVALDDQRVASVGVAKNWDEGGSGNAYVKAIGPMGLEWEGRYDRALSWCPEQSEGEPWTEEVFIDVVRLADDSLLVVGHESGGYGSEQIHQPLALHVSAQGEVLSRDRGFWRGEAVAAVGAEDGSAYALMYEFDGANQQHLLVRKYLP